MSTATNTKTVFVGLSGGVDSSVAAARLIDQGYNVVGVFIKVWHPDWMVCNWEQERLDAMRVAAHLGIPFLTCDAEAAYKNDVADYFIGEYQAGRTPNPDVMCNQYVKFGRFLEFAEEKGADYIATGHYARRIEKTDASELHRGVDTGKDQTYFLWTLTNEQLTKSLFPIGDTPKEQIRQEALRRGIPVATKKDSQGICFLGHVDIAEFLGHYIDLVPGQVIDTTGRAIGTHDGALIYTLGQRHGFSVSVQADNQGALYIVDRDLKANTITVAPSVEESNTTSELTLSNPILRQPLAPGNQIQYQIRYRQTPQTAVVERATTDSITLHLPEEQPRPAAGQSCVLYDGEHCLGGGILT